MSIDSSFMEMEKIEIDLVANGNAVAGARPENLHCHAPGSNYRSWTNVDGVIIIISSSSSSRLFSLPSGSSRFLPVPSGSATVSHGRIEIMT